MKGYKFWYYAVLYYCLFVSVFVIGSWATNNCTWCVGTIHNMTNGDWLFIHLLSAGSGMLVGLLQWAEG